MSSKATILDKLRAARKPFEAVPPVNQRLHMVTLPDTSTETLQARFIQEAETLGCRTYCLTPTEAIELIKKMIGSDPSVLSWDSAYIPLPNLYDQLDIRIAQPDDGNVRVGITGVDFALAATGSLVVSSGKGKARTVSLLPDVHIALMTPDQLLPDFETWLSQQDDFKAFRQAANQVVISGPSKTADIAQELIKGAHGPREVHIIILS